VIGTQFPQSASPVTLLPVGYVSSGNITTGSASGFAAINSITGRGVGSFNVSGGSSSAVALYQVNPGKLLMLRFGASSQNPSLEWMISN
jgi:hypothetical protein